MLNVSWIVTRCPPSEAPDFGLPSLVTVTVSVVGDSAGESGLVPSRECDSIGLILMDGRTSAIEPHGPSMAYTYQSFAAPKLMVSSPDAVAQRWWFCRTSQSAR